MRNLFFNGHKTKVKMSNKTMYNSNIDNTFIYLF